MQVLNDKQNKNTNQSKIKDSSLYSSSVGVRLNKTSENFFGRDNSCPKSNQNLDNYQIEKIKKKGYILTSWL